MFSKRNQQQRFSFIWLVAVCFLCIVLPLYALDNTAWQDYGNIGPVMYYDPATGESRPFLPIGWYFWWPDDGPLLDEVAASGANTVVFTSNDNAVPWMFAKTGAGLNKAQLLGLKVIVGFAPVMLNDPSNLITWVQTYRNHPALLGWQLGDENGPPITAQMVNDAATVVRLLDPHHQIWQVFQYHDDEAKLVEYMQETDVVSYDRYGYFDWVAPFDGGTWNLELQNHKAAIGAANGWAGNVNVIQGLGNDVAGPANFIDFRFPDYDEYRHLVFSSYASSGARGILSWIYYYDDLTWYSDPNLFTTWRDTVCKPIQLEQRTIAHAMETGWNVGKVSADTDGQYIPGPDPGRPYARISHLLTYDDIQQVYYLIVTNNTFDTMNVELTLSDLPDPITSLTAEIPEDSSLLQMQDLGDGKFLIADTYPNHAVKIYLLRADGTPAACGDLGTVYLDADLVRDCYVHLPDYAKVASQWLHCTNPADAGCNAFWNSQPNTVHADDFNRPDGELYLGSTDWENANSGKNWHIVENNTIRVRGNDFVGSGSAVGDVYVGALPAGENYQRVSIEYMPRSTGYSPTTALHLHFDGRNNIFLSEKTYRLTLRGNKDMQISKLGAATGGQGGPEELTSGWHGYDGGDMTLDTWYRLTLELDRTTRKLTGTVTTLDGSAQLGQLSITDTGTLRSGGWVAITEYYQLSANSVRWDNFEYEIGQGKKAAACGQVETVYLDADIVQNCYVDLADLGRFFLQWLACSDPAQAACDTYWK
jgi:hypothetical protein